VSDAPGANGPDDAVPGSTPWERQQDWTSRPAEPTRVDDLLSRLSADDEVGRRSRRRAAGDENTATVWSNANWRLFVRAAGPAFTESPTGANTIPLNRLRVTGTRGVTLGANDKRIANGAATGTAGVAVPINYALTLRFADKANTPGSSYQQILIYTAVTP